MFLFPIAPSSPPQNVTTQALSPTSIEVTFVPTADINQNGLIIRYNVTYTGQTFDTVTQSVIVNVTNAVYPSTLETFSVNLTGLQEYNNYTIRVSAINGIGAGPFSDGIVGLLIDFIVCKFGLLSCTYKLIQWGRLIVSRILDRNLLVNMQT